VEDKTFETKALWSAARAFGRLSSKDLIWCEGTKLNQRDRQARKDTVKSKEKEG
jgi:hypothetical protein